MKVIDIWLTLLLLCAFATATVADTEAAYQASVEKWWDDREARLKSDTGWLSVTGLFRLHHGENRFGSDPGNDIVLPLPSAAQAGTICVRGRKGGRPREPGRAHTARRQTHRHSTVASGF